MAHCTKCGAAIADNAGFCGSCGAPQSAGSESSGAAPVAASAQTGLEQNVAGALCYALGWITGLIFFFIDKRPYVRFHAAQSIVVFGGLNILSFALGIFFGFGIMAGGMVGFSAGFLLIRIVQLAAFILWIVLMIKAYQGQKFRLPVAADLAESILGKS